MNSTGSGEAAYSAVVADNLRCQLYGYEGWMPRPEPEYIPGP